jgi:hypothetical protein
MLIYWGFPKHWEIVNGELREVLSGFREFTTSNWGTVIVGAACIGFLWVIFVLSLKHPIGGAFIWIILSIIIIGFTISMVTNYVVQYIDKIWIVCFFFVGSLFLILSILNLRYGYQKIIEPGVI